MRVETTGIFNVSEADYHADPCPGPSLSSSLAATIHQSTPRHAWLQHPRLNPQFAPEENDTFSLGKAAHAWLLEGEQRFTVCDFKDWRTNDAKAAKQAALDAGKTPLLPHQRDAVFRLCSAIRAQLPHLEIPGLLDMTQGKAEQTIVWREGAAWCRARPDWLRDDHKIIVDLKIHGRTVNPENLARHIYDMTYDLRGAFYQRGVRSLGKCDSPEFFWLFAEDKPPHAVSLVTLKPAGWQLAEVKAGRAVQTWAWCMENDRWPGYGGQIAYLETPVYEAIKHDDREALHETHPNLLQTMMDWQAPLEAKGAAE